MSEAARIREAARGIHRPDDTRELSSTFEASPPATARNAAHEFRQLAQRARLDVYRKIKAVGTLFGDEVAAAIEPPLEEYGEMIANTLDMLALSEHQLRQQHAADRRIADAAHRDICQKRAELAELLADAATEHEKRQARTAPSRRQPDPAWVVAYRAYHDDRTPF